MKTYKCRFPNCDYTTNNRNQIHNHHIIPKENNGNDKKNNKMFLCPTHHSFIFIPEAKSGIHSVKHKNSIIIINVLDSTKREVLEYIQENETKYFFY